MTVRRLRLPAVLLVSVGCTGDGVLVPLSPGPVIEAAAVSANPHNVLGAVVAVQARHADSVRVRYSRDGSGTVEATPAIDVVDDGARIPVLGLLPDTPYDMQVVAYGGAREASGATLSFTTGPLPSDLPRFVAEGAGAAPGYVAFAAGRYAVVIDNTGRVVWYRHFAAGAGLNFQPQPTGEYAALPPTGDPGREPEWVLLDPLGNVTRTLTCARGLRPRLHDLLAQTDGSSWLLCDETRVLDLSGAGGHAAATVTATVVQHVSAAGALLFEWSAFDHFDITDVDPAERSGSTVNWTHGNALDIDPEGNLLVSFRNLSEITSIDTRTGSVNWRLGGARNQFVFENAPGAGFARQHGVRAFGAGSLLLLDNLGDPAGTRAERYVFDAGARTARLAASSGPFVHVTAQLGGTVQLLPGNRTLVSFGSAGYVAEYDAAGAEVWRLVDPGYVFRAQRIGSLYAPGAGPGR